MKRLLVAAFALSAALFAWHPADAASINGMEQVVICDPTTNQGKNCAKPDSSGNLPITGSISASLNGFTPTAAATANVTDVVNTSQDVALPAGTDVVVTNKGSVDVNFRIQVGAGTAVSTDQTLKAGAAIGLHVGTATHLSVIAPTGTGTGATAGQVNIQGGAGLATGYGGSSSSGSSGAIYGPTATGSAAANPPVQAGGTINGGATGNVQGFAMKAASTAPAATDPALVVAVSPNGGQATAALQPTNAAQGSTTSGQTGPLVQGAVTTSAPTYTTAQTNPLSLDTAGNLRDVEKNSASILSAVQGAIPAGTNLIGKVGIDQTTPGTTNGVQVNAALPAGTNVIGKTSIDQTTPGTTNAVQAIAGTTGGTTPFTLTAAASTNATNIKASAGLVDHVSVYNISATPAWVSFYDTASTPTCGTGIKYQVLAPANSTSGAGAVEDYAIGVGHTSGIGICFTTGIAGTGNVAASSYVVNVFYK